MDRPEMNLNQETVLPITSRPLHIITPEIRPGFGLLAVWRRRELLGMFIQRHIFARYRQMLLGVLWSVAEPLGTLLILTFLFGFVIRVDTGGAEGSEYR